jgi:uroporphyrin-III C-methyltransferase/precorrin-2 dehydrogenase/sirohydrochlorin ferrochelatase
VQYITAHDRNGKLPDDIDWSSVADPAATTVIYMPKKTLGELTARAIAHGLDPATPAVAIAGATRSNETVFAGPVSQIAEKLAQAKPDGPMLVLLGRAMQSALTSRTTETSTNAGVKSA